ncbi:MAG: hypothetical protein WD824_03480, partial [Cyclobacteriaceae bacterium]
VAPYLMRPVVFLIGSQGKEILPHKQHVLLHSLNEENVNSIGITLLMLFVNFKNFSLANSRLW